MRIRLLVLTLSLAALTTHAQNDLSDSQKTSVYTYVYRLTSKQALILFRKDMEGWDKMILQPVDSFLTTSRDEDDLHLSSGDYLFVLARGSRLEATLHSIGPLRYDLLSSGKEASLSLHTPDGKSITDAIVYTRHHRTGYDSASNSYRLGAWRNTRVVNIVEQGALYYFSVESDKQFSYYSRRSRLERVSTPPRRAYYRIRNLFRPKPYRSFLVFNKPKYKPGDTVRCKAFIMTSTGRPIRHPLQIRLSGNQWRSLDTVIGHVIPYRPGGYSFTFALTDSLRLDLDERYRVSLEQKAGKPLAEETFEYEDYTLGSIQLKARVDKTVNSPGDPVSLYIKATDENDLPIPDGRVRILVGSAWSGTGFHRPAVFIPDTLWSLTQPLDPFGETRIILPDSIFPAASFHYNLHCTLLNSDNDRRERNFSLQYRDDSARIFIEPQNDSVRIDYRVNGKSRPAPAAVYAYNRNDEEVARSIASLPATLRVNPFASEYDVSVPVQGDSLTESWTCDQLSPTVSLAANRTHDSISLQVVNPQHLEFWYTIKAGRRLLQAGYGDTLFYQSASVTPAPYTVTLQYRWADHIQKSEYPVPFRDQLLQVQVRQPEFAYPGEQATIAIDVTDSRGRPVPGADLTALAYTAKFGGSDIGNHVPYFGREFSLPKQHYYSLPENSGSPEKDDIRLDWQRWGRALGLDTIEYFKFLNPDTLYLNRESDPANKTSIAPFVSRKGEPEAVHLVYIDERLVFFSRTDQLSAYSFLVSPGFHSLRLRTATSEIRLDSIRIEKGTKTFLDVNDDPANRSVHIRAMPDTLTANEQTLLRRSLIGIQSQYDYRYVLLSQGDDRRYLLNARQNFGYASTFLAGPFADESATLRVEDDFTQPFDPEGGYRFWISKGLIKEKEWQPPMLLRTRLEHPGSPDKVLHDRPMTTTLADSLWQDYLDIRSQTMDLFHNETLGQAGNGSLRIEVSDPPHSRQNERIFVKKVFLFRYDFPDYMRIYSGQTRSLGYIEPGRYRIFVLLKAQRYLVADSIVIRPDGLNYVDIPAINIHPADSFSRHIADLLKQQEDHWTDVNSPELEPMRATFNDRYLPAGSLQRSVDGRVVNKDGQPISFASIFLKGTRYGTNTNRQGYFRLLTTDRGVLVISAIGYVTRTVNLQEPYTYDIRLEPSLSGLDEVVVVGYGVSKKKDLAYSVVTIGSRLAGKVAGIQIKGSPQLPPAPESGNMLRRHFRDDAWWQAGLRTDQNGTASFPVKFPDDITNWSTFVIAVTDHRQTGVAEGNIRSFKALSAALSVPAFLIAGDSARVIGKILNYMPDTATVTRTFTVNGLEMATGEYRLRTAHLDSFLVIAVPLSDSLHLRYTLRQPNGDFDGEERAIPIYPAGARETKGSFATLEGDTTLQLGFDTSRGPVHITATASVLPVLLDEIEHLHRYEYGCNEQLASKLKALLLKKQIIALERQPFREEATIKELIQRLMKNRNSGLWGWWPESEPAAWVTLHVAEALLEAERQGFSTGLDKTALTNFLVFRMESRSQWDRLFNLRLLQELQAKVDYKRYIEETEKTLDREDLYPTLLLMEIRQAAGMEVRLDTIVARRSLTALGSCYWGNDKGGLWDNPVQRTLLMYRLLRQAGAYNDLLPKIRNYFLEERGPGHWRNTYESSLILQTLLPDLLKTGEPLTPISLRLRGGPANTPPTMVSSFPFQASWPATSALTVHKQGTLPVYFTAFQQYWDPQPDKVTGTFAVHSRFESGGRQVLVLTAGQPVDMVIDVNVKGDADYVMIEAPIPAGCTYLNKNQPYDNQEVHPEYFKNKLSIFCGYLQKGPHTFRVSLLPRYTGSYRLNPARAELMYFPVLYGRDGMRMVTID
ncbi:MAG TPA: alpha-2-macroglobulin family protein [Puia sp.]|nr:alpha-2-macroglobulin family protein [Puia sp.]